MKRRTPEAKHRYTLVLSESLGNQVEDMAAKHGTTFTGLVRRFVEFGLTVEKTLDDGGQLIKRENGQDTEMVFLDRIKIR